MSDNLSIKDFFLITHLSLTCGLSPECSVVLVCLRPEGLERAHENWLSYMICYMRLSHVSVVLCCVCFFLHIIYILRLDN